MKRLIQDEEWNRLAVDNLEVLKQRHREGLGHWAGVLLATDRLAEVLERHAALDVAIFELQRPLRRVTRHLTPDWETSAVTQWEGVLASAIELHEQMMREAGRDGWENREGRLALTATSARGLHARSRR